MSAVLGLSQNDFQWHDDCEFDSLLMKILKFVYELNFNFFFLKDRIIIVFYFTVMIFFPTSTIGLNEQGAVDIRILKLSLYHTNIDV